MAFGFGVGKTVERKKGTGSFGFGVERKKEKEPTKEVEEFQLPEHLGGGSFKTAGPGTLVLTPRDYGGIDTVPGSERHHIVPVALGGTAGEGYGIRVLPNEDHDKISDVGNRAIKDYQDGKISLPEARLVNLTALQRLDDNLDEKSWFQKVADKADFVDNVVGFWDKLTGKSFGFGKEERAKEPEKPTELPGPRISKLQPKDTISAPVEKERPWPLRVAETVYQVPKESLDRFVKSIDKSLQAGIERQYSDRLVEEGLVERELSQTTAGKAARGLDIVLSGLGLIPGWLAFTTALQAAEDVPVVKYPAQAINAVLGGVAEVAGTVAGETVDALPNLSDEAKAELRRPIEEVAGLLAQIFVAHRVVKITGETTQASPTYQRVSSVLTDTARKTGEVLETKVRDKVSEGVVISPEVAKQIANDTIKQIEGEMATSYSKQGDVGKERFFYHGTESSNIKSIAARGLLPSGRQTYAGTRGVHFADVEGKASINKRYFPDNVLLRVKESPGIEIKPSGNEFGDFISSKGIPPENVEILLNGKWIPITESVNAKPAPNSSVGTKKPHTAPVKPGEAVIPKEAPSVPSKPVESVQEAPKAAPESRTSGVSKALEAKALEKGLTSSGFDKLAEYTPAVKAEQAQRISELMKRDIEAAKRMASGKEAVPDGIRSEALFKLMSDHAERTGDVQLVMDLAKSPIASEISAAGSKLSLTNIGEESSTSAVKAIRRISEARKAKGERKVKKDVERAKKEVKKKPIKFKDWDSFVDSITC